MYSEEKIAEIVNTLLEGTKSGYIKWSHRGKIPKPNATDHYMEYKSDDGLTEFNLKIDLEDDLMGVDDNWCFMYIRHKDLIDGKIHISNRDYPEIADLSHLIYDKFLKQNILKNMPKKGVLDSILGNINKQHHREEQIDDILEDESKPSLEKEHKPKTKIVKDEPYKEKMSHKVDEAKKEEPKKKKWWKF